MNHDDTETDRYREAESSENGATVSRRTGLSSPGAGAATLCGAAVPADMNGHTSVRDAEVTNRTATAGLATTASTGRSEPTGQTVDGVGG